MIGIGHNWYGMKLTEWLLAAVFAVPAIGALVPAADGGNERRRGKKKRHMNPHRSNIRQISSKMCTI
jgi:hypothetical protein